MTLRLLAPMREAARRQKRNGGENMFRKAQPSQPFTTSEFLPRRSSLAPKLSAVSAFNPSRLSLKAETFHLSRPTLHERIVVERCQGLLGFAF